MKWRDDEEIDDVPASARLVERDPRCGSVPGVGDDELVDPYELERHVVMTEWGPLLENCRGRGDEDGIRPAIDEDGRVDWGAFATVDFDRTMPAFDKARYKVDRLRERQRDALIMVSIIKPRLPRAKYLVLKYLRLGIIDMDQVENDDMLALAKFESRARRIQREIRDIEEGIGARRRQQFAAVLG